MAIRIRRSIKIAPGVRINVGKKGMSTSIGGKGLTVNLSKKGTRVTASLPGTGVSASHLYKAAPETKLATPQREYTSGEVLFSLGVILAASFTIFCLSSGFIAVVAGIIAAACAIGFLALKVESASIKRSFSSPQNEMYWTKKAAQLQTKHTTVSTESPAVPETSEPWQERVARIERERDPTSDDSPISQVGLGLKQWRGEDYLGQAAAKLASAKDSVRECRFDESWGLFHEVKELYAKHAERFGFTSSQLTLLDSSVHEHMANQLRLQGRHRDALIHIMYWVIASSSRPLKSHPQKLGAYFRRCKLQRTDIAEVEVFVSLSEREPDFRKAQIAVADWFARDGL